MTRAPVLNLAFVTGWVMGSAAWSAARADDGPAAARHSAAEVAQVQVAQFLPTTTSAAVSTSASVTTAWGGYDGASQTPIISLGTELRIVRRLALVVGGSYDQSNANSLGLRPRVGLRLQVLRQDASALDLSTSLTFRQDRFTSEDGMFQAAVAVGRTFDRTSLVANVIYAQDGEGDDHEVEVRLAALRRLRGGLHVGVEGRYMHAVDSTDPRRQQLGTPSMEAAAGPVVAYMAGNWVVAMEAGYSGRVTDRTRSGLAMLGGLGAAF